MPKELQDKSSTSPNPVMDAAVFFNFRACSEVYKWIKWDIQKIHEVSIPTHQEPTSLKARARSYGENIEHCALWKFPDRYHCQSKTDVILLSGVRFGQIKTRSKENFVHCAMEQSLGILSVMYIKEKYMEWRWHGRVIKKEIATKQKDALGKPFISDQAQHGK
jgi:hypothetical protein